MMKLSLSFSKGQPQQVNSFLQVQGPKWAAEMPTRTCIRTRTSPGRFEGCELQDPWVTVTRKDQSHTSFSSQAFSIHSLSQADGR